MSPRERLERAAVLAGYGPQALFAIAEAALPNYRAPAPLGEEHFKQVLDCVEVIAQAGLHEAEIPALVGQFQASGPAWQGDFWTQVVRVASMRFNRPDLYGLSPCEDDPGRLAQWGGPVAQTALSLAHATTAQLPAAA